MKIKTDKIGTLTLGGRVHVSDPCYETDCWCAGTLENVLPGRYNCKIIRCHDDLDDEIPGMFERVRSLIICHEDYIRRAKEHVPIDVGVDSGQAGFYDLPYYEQYHKVSGPDHCDEAWYNRVCKTTLKRMPNPHYISEQDFIHKALGKEYISLWEIDRAVAEGKINESEAQTRKLAYFREACKYMKSPLQSWPTMEVGYAGILDDQCCVCSSGYGDGGYDCFVGRNDAGQIVSARIQFI